MTEQQVNAGPMAKILTFITERGLPLLSFAGLLLAYHLLFRHFFPSSQGTLGHDYSRVLPELLDGFHWFRQNGWFRPFLFTPGFCGGLPAFADPQSAYYSIPQLLAFFIDPLSSVYLSILIFASLGFWGFYVLLRRSFGTSDRAAVLGGGLFMFNGFFIHRMLIGHLPFHGIMLLPWSVYFLLQQRDDRRGLRHFADGFLAGAVAAYGTYSGMAQLIAPYFLAVFGLVAAYRLMKLESCGLVIRLSIAVIVFLALSAAKLVAAFSFLQHFPRTGYPLPGINGLGNELVLIIRMLFLSSAGMVKQAISIIVNIHWLVGREELEFGITMVPAALIMAAIAGRLWRKSLHFPRLRKGDWLWWGILAGVVLLPLAMNLYQPEWNAFLKKIPIIKSSSILLRWFFPYIPLLILGAALSLDSIVCSRAARSALLLISILLLVWQTASVDRNYYRDQPYSPDTIEQAWQVSRTANPSFRIESIGGILDGRNQVKLFLNGNDWLASHASQLACTNPIFGYRLENFPIKSLHLGSVLDVSGDWLNMKNPACYLYPQENNCNPGDQFTTDQRVELLAFASYSPYPFRQSNIQWVANLVTSLTLVLLVILTILRCLPAEIWRKG